MHNGGLNGQGLGNSIAKRQFLPEPWTDFIAAVIAEELGFVGIVILISLFGALLWRRTVHCTTRKGCILDVLGNCTHVYDRRRSLLQSRCCHGCCPAKGLVLPFISYGSSAMMANMTAIGILIGISAERKETPIEKGWYKAPCYRIPYGIRDKPQLSEALDKLEELGSVEEVSVESATTGTQS